MNNKWIYYSTMLLALASCSKIQEELVEPQVETTPVTNSGIVVNTVIPVTKTTISEDGDAYKMAWEGNENAKLLERRVPDSYTIAGYDSNNAVLTGEKMAFSFGPLTTPPEGQQTGYDIVCPKNAFVSSNALKAKLNIPANQTPKAGTPDPAASLLCGRVDGTFDVQPSSVNASFGHLAAYGRMNLRGVPSEESITSITIEAEDCDIAGQLEYNTYNGTISNTSVTTENAITLDGTNLTANPSGFDVWFACKPFTLAAGKKLTITTVTSASTHTAVLTAGVDIVFTAGIVTEFPASADTYTVTFDTQGGSVVAPKIVRKGYAVSAPADPTKEGTLAEGLYLGDIEDAEQGALFVGWCTDPECTVDYDFSTPVTGDLTLYAKWDTQTPIAHGIAEPDDDTWNAGNDYPYYGLTYVNNQSLASETHYTIVMNSNCTVWNKSVTLNNANAVVRIIGKTSERTISRSNLNTVFNVTAGTLIMGKNLKCTYTGTQNNPFFNVNGAGATLVFDEGCTFDGTGKTLPTGKGIIDVNGDGAKFILNGGKITGCTFSYRPVNVKHLDAQFIINDGSIDNNTFNTVLYQSDWAETSDRKTQFVMNGGSISNNIFSNYLIYLKNDHRVVQITGGEITNNTASGDEAAMAPIYVTNGRLSISGGEISGNSVEITNGTGLAAGAIFVSGWANDAGSEFYVEKTGGIIEGNSASRTVAAESTGRLGQQLLYSVGTNRYKRDADIAAGTAFNTNHYAGSFGGFWTTASSAE